MAQKQPDLFALYKRLYAHFGPQHWWPLVHERNNCLFLESTSGGSAMSARKEDADRRTRGRGRSGALSPTELAHENNSADCQFEICIGAILTQNTAWTNVEKALRHLAKERLMTSERIAAVPLATLKRAIRSTGYFNQKAKKLKVFAKFLHSHTAQYGSVAGYRVNMFDRWRKMPTPRVREALLSVWGIGPETADSIILYAVGKPVFVIDAYTKRLLGMLGVQFQTYEEYRRFFEDQLPPRVKLWNEYHALIVAWGKLLAKDPKAARKILGLS